VLQQQVLVPLLRVKLPTQRGRLLQQVHSTSGKYQASTLSVVPDLSLLTRLPPVHEASTTMSPTQVDVLLANSAAFPSQPYPWCCCACRHWFPSQQEGYATSKPACAPQC
jgi:hypothetical protein